MSRQKLTDKDIAYIRNTLRGMGETEEYIAEEVARHKRLHGYEGTEGNKIRGGNND